MKDSAEYLVERDSTYAWLSPRQYRTALRWANDACMVLPCRIPARRKRSAYRYSVGQRLTAAAIMLRRRLTGRRWCKVMEYR